MIDVRKAPYIAPTGLKLKDLKEILARLPDENANGWPFEVWITTAPNISNVVKQVWSLNKREDGCDIILEV